MRPERVTLKNIGPFKGSHTVDFTGLGDIFLVYGKTGAGKTTIFDSICYAFYGDAPGSRKGLAKQMRSQFAEDGDESAVSLEFSLGQRRYRVKRTLASERIGPRNGKLQTVAEEVTLEEWSGGAWKDISSTNKSETDASILALIGLSADEFSRIVLLPQGEFARFLRQNSTERKEVLSKLFPVEKYARVIELARTRAKEAELKQKETVNAILSLGESFNDRSYASDRASLAADAAALRERQASLRKEHATLAVLLEKSRAAAEKRARLASLESALAELAASEGEIARMAEELSRARLAEPLTVTLSHIDGIESRLGELKAERSSLDREISNTKRSIAELEADAPRVDGLRKAREALLLRKEALKTAVEIAAGLAEELESAKAMGVRLAAAKDRLASITAETDKRTARLAEIESEAADFEARESEFNGLRDGLERLKRLKTLAEDHEREAKAIAAHEAAVAAAKSAVAEGERDVEIARAELEALEAESARLHASESASALSSLLEPGKPCPVCGSVEHPRPATPLSIGGIGVDERVASAKRRIEALGDSSSKKAGELAAREASLTDARERLSLSIERYCAASGEGGTCVAPDAIPSTSKATETLQEASRLTQAASDSLARARAAVRERDELRRRDAADAQERSRLSSEIEKISGELSSANTKIEVKRSRYMEAFAGTANAGADKPAREALGSMDAADALEECEAEILESEATIDSHDERLAKARENAASLSARIAALDRNALTLASDGDAERASIREGLTAAGFAGIDDLRAAHRARDAQERLAAAIDAHGKETASTRAQKLALERELAADGEPVADGIEERIAAMDAEINAIGAGLEEKSAALSGLDGLKARWDELEAERSARVAESGRLVALANDLTGNNPAKVSFDAWILGMYLEEITAFANERLTGMSEGRYRIRLNDSYRKGNGLAGLDLEILDAYTGRARPSGTLSGGETFMASISLALGLADSIQSRSGGIQLDAVFIDEGFGSLDESSLERAMCILDEIRGSRMVGLISHVAELRSRVPNRIEVVKTGGGSTIIQASSGDQKE